MTRGAELAVIRRGRYKQDVESVVGGRRRTIVELQGRITGRGIEVDVDLEEKEARVERT